MRYNHGVPLEHEVTALVVGALIIHFQWVILAIIIVCIAYQIMKIVVPKRPHRHKLRRHDHHDTYRHTLYDREGEYVARAVAEDREWQEAGIYEGNYPGATMPLTEPLPDGTGPVDWSKIIKPR